MKTAGEILKTAREKKGIGLEEVASTTKIKKKFLENIEANKFQDFSSAVAVRGFVKNYAEFLGLSSGPVLAVFKRDFTDRKKKNLVVGGANRPVDQSVFCWSPRLTLVAVVGFVFLTLMAYLGYQYFSLVKKPKLEVFSPQEGQEVLTKEIEVVGKADPDTTVSVNGNLVSSSGGDFRSLILLLPGENKIVLEATNQLGKKTTVIRTVFHPNDTESSH